MARGTIFDKADRCKGCAAFDRVSLTLEFCTFHKRPVFAQDRGCPDIIDASPWLHWAIDGTANDAQIEDRENDR